MYVMQGNLTKHFWTFGNPADFCHCPHCVITNATKVNTVVTKLHVTTLIAVSCLLVFVVVTVCCNCLAPQSSVNSCCWCFVLLTPMLLPRMLLFCRCCVSRFLTVGQNVECKCRCHYDMLQHYGDFRNNFGRTLLRLVKD